LKKEEAILAELMAEHSQIKRDLNSVARELQNYVEDLLKRQEKETRYIRPA
jgi:hypothetical protein